MSRSTFEKLHEMLRPSWHSKRTGRPGYSLEYCLYITLWKLCNTNSFREIGDRFYVAWNTAYNIFIKVVKLISKLKNKTILFPSNQTSQRRTVEDFENSRSHPFPFVLGCIDGTHIRITAPKKDPTSKYNRKGTYSILVQGVVDSKLRFIDAFVGYQGSCHDAIVWKNSPLKKVIINRTLNFPPECHLLGDAAYPLELHLMVPYRDNRFLTSQQKTFNTVLSSTRVCVEQAFGILKKKFRILNHLELQHLYLAKHIIMACIVIHNIIINTEGSDFSSQYENNEDNTMITHLTPAENNERSEARRKRDAIATLLSC